MHAIAAHFFFNPTLPFEYHMFGSSTVLNIQVRLASIVQLQLTYD